MVREIIVDYNVGIIKPIFTIVNTIQIRNQLKQYIDQLSAQDLKIVGEVITDLINPDESAPTDELEKIAGFEEAFIRGKADIEAGRVTNWRTIRNELSR